MSRFVVLGAAPARAAWFHDIARWATTAALPVDFVKAVSAVEIRARLRSGRRFSAVLLDGALPGLDRDLLDLARAEGATPIVVVAAHAAGRWRDLGAAQLDATALDRDALLTCLRDVAHPVRRPEVATDADPAAATGPITAPTASAASDPAWRGRLVAVTGGGGSGRSTLAVALAQGLSRDARYADLTCLADLALHADQALLHDTPDVVPGVAELVEAHRSGRPDADAVRALTWAVADHGYHVLLGLRRHRDWTAIRPRSFDAAVDGLRRGFRVVVADVDADLEGEDACGSADVEERNAMARVTLGRADVVAVSGGPGLAGVHRLLRTVRDALDHGVPGDRIVPVVNRAPRHSRRRAELRIAFERLLSADRPGHDVRAPVFVPDRRRLDDVVRDGTRVPAPIIDAITGPVTGLLARSGADADRHAAPATASHEPVLVAPGSLGSWTDPEDLDL